jgi:hypothetical protein
MNFQKATCEPAGKAKNPSSECSMFHIVINIQADRFAMVSSVITKIFNPSKYWMVTNQLLLNDTLLISACIVQFFFVQCLFATAFCSIQCF